MPKFFGKERRADGRYLRIFGIPIRYKKKLKHVASSDSKVEAEEIPFPHYFEQREIEFIKFVKSYTMTSVLRMHALYNAICYLERNSIEGDIVECGVWKGGSCMLAAMTLKALGNTNRKLYLYDTFYNMTKPTEYDVYSKMNIPATDYWHQIGNENDISEWRTAGLDEVKANIGKTGYPDDNVIYIRGKVEDTLLSSDFPVPDKIALLRLDTDWYESTKIELEALFPKVQSDGILLIDDYNFWGGSKKAVDEYLESTQTRIFLNRIDDSGMIAVKSFC